MPAKPMKWSWRLTRIAGIEVSVHLTFFLLLLWVAISVWQHAHSHTAVLQGLAFVLVLFLCVVLHEFGHAFTARRFGVRTRRITLLPIGGVASMEKMPEEPRQEILVALAGPAVNIVIATLLGLYLAVTGTSPPAMEEDPLVLFRDGTAFLYHIMVINVVLAVFNLLPAFPMDGGRVLRGLLALFMPRHLATRRAATVGQVLAVGMFGLGLLYNPLLLLISVFIWLGATTEAGAEQLQHALHDFRARDVMLTRFEVLHEEDTLDQALDAVLQSSQKHFPVLYRSAPPRVLNQTGLLALMRDHSSRTALRDLSLPELTLIGADGYLSGHLPDMQSTPDSLLGVEEDGELVGIISLERLLDWLRFNQKRHPRETSKTL